MTRRRRITALLPADALLTVAYADDTSEDDAARVADREVKVSKTLYRAERMPSLYFGPDREA